jgi:hypothetical protein
MRNCLGRYLEIGAGLRQAAIGGFMELALTPSNDEFTRRCGDHRSKSLRQSDHLSKPGIHAEEVLFGLRLSLCRKH